MSRAIDLLEHWQETCVLEIIGTADGLAVAVHAEPAAAAAEQTLQLRSDCNPFTFCIPAMPLLCPGPDGP